MTMRDDRSYEFGASALFERPSYNQYINVPQPQIDNGKDVRELWSPTID